MERFTVAANILETHSRLEDLQLAVKSPLQNIITKAFEDLRSCLDDLCRNNEELILTSTKLERECQCYSKLYEQESDSYLLTDLEGTIHGANIAASVLLGVDQEFLIGKSIKSFMAESDRLLLNRNLIRLGQGVKISDMNLRITPMGRPPTPTSYSATIIYDSHNRINGIQWRLREIVDDKEAGNSKVTSGLENNLKSEFLSIMSHELRTPINSIMGMTSVLHEEGLTKDQKECIEVIRTSAEDLLALINDILYFTRIEKEILELEYETFDIENAIKEVVDLVAMKAIEKRLRLTYYIDSSLPKTIIGDANRIRQVLLNLLHNAIKFTDEGDIRVSVKAKQTSAERFELLFSVTDTGIGIPEDKIDRLFKSFSQVDMSPSRKHGGMGLGLAISKKLIELMGGRIWAESESGKGSTFCFTIFVNASHDTPKMHEKVDSHSDERTTKVNLHSQALRILLAEDNIITQKVMQKLLGKIGYRVDIAANGREVVEALERQRYNIILMDVEMPEMDGIEATKIIRQRWRPEDQPYIIAVTAYALEGDRERCIEAGMDDYLAKPVKMEDLKSVLDGFAGRITVRPVCLTEKPCS